MNRQEIEAMFSLSDLKDTKVYQEALEEGREEGEERGRIAAKLEAIPRMLRLGFSLEVIAESLDLSLEIVQKEARKINK